MGFVKTLRDRILGRSEQPRPDGEQLYRDLRARILTVSPAELNLSPTSSEPTVWAALMDWHVGSGVATLVAVADGTVSLYLSYGGGIIGAGTHEDVLRSARRFLTALGAHRGSLGRQDDAPLPGANGVRFIARTFEGTLVSVEIAADELGDGQHELSPVFDVAQELIAVIREASERPRA